MRRDSTRLELNHLSALPAKTLITSVFRQVLNCRLATDRLRIESHQIENIGWHVGPDRQSETLRRVMGDRMVVGPGTLRQQPGQLIGFPRRALGLQEFANFRSYQDTSKRTPSDPHLAGGTIARGSISLSCAASHDTNINLTIQSQIPFPDTSLT